MILKGRCISKGIGTGELMYTDTPISFLGGVDIKTGIIIDPKHPLCGKSISGKVFAFPYGVGSTVGSYVIYGLSKNNVAPAAIINQNCETIIATGAIIAGIPLVDQVSDISEISKISGTVTVNGNTGEIITS